MVQSILNRSGVGAACQQHGWKPTTGAAARGRT